MLTDHNPVRIEPVIEYYVNLDWSKFAEYKGPNYILFKYRIKDIIERANKC